MKKTVTTYSEVDVSWCEYSRPFHSDRYERGNCTVVDNGTSLITIIFPEGDSIRKMRTAAGFTVNGKPAQFFFITPNVSPSQIKRGDKT